MADATGNTLANEAQVTLKAKDAFDGAVAKLTSIVSGVFESQQQLTSTAMVTTAGERFGGVVVQWAQDFEDLRSTLNWMSQQLGDTPQQLTTATTQPPHLPPPLPPF